MEWCLPMEMGIITPDLIIFLQCPVEKIVKRFNKEDPLEDVDYQALVLKEFEKIKNLSAVGFTQINALNEFDKNFSKIRNMTRSSLICYTQNVIKRCTFKK